jgi:hypothetical protein
MCIIFSIIALLIIPKRFRILNIYDNNVLCFEYKHYNEVETEPGKIYAKYKSVYSILPFKINTDLGYIYIRPFSNIELRGNDFSIYWMELFISNNKYNLEVFGNKIENIERFQIGHYRLSMDVVQEFILDGKNEYVDFMDYNRMEKIFMFRTMGASEYKYVYTTLEGEIVKTIEIY